MYGGSAAGRKRQDGALWRAPRAARRAQLAVVKRHLTKKSRIPRPQRCAVVVFRIAAVEKEVPAHGRADDISQNREAPIDSESFQQSAFCQSAETKWPRNQRDFAEIHIYVMTCREATRFFRGRAVGHHALGSARNQQTDLAPLIGAILVMDRDARKAGEGAVFSAGENQIGVRGRAIAGKLEEGHS